MDFDLTGVITAVTVLISGLGIAKMQARTAGGARKLDRTAQLEEYVGTLHQKLTDDRTRHYEVMERLMGEEEELRDSHAVRLAVERQKTDDLRMQVTALRAELLRRGVNPNRVSFDDSVQANALPQFEGRWEADFVEDNNAKPRVRRMGRRSTDPIIED